MQHALQIVKNKLQSVLFDSLMLNPPKTRILPKTLKSKICAFYIWLQVAVTDCHRMSWKLSDKQNACHERCAHQNG
jgi:hypothetical protein